MHDIAQESRETDLSGTGRERLLSVPGEPLFIADWDRVLMIHYEVEKALLQGIVPFQLDLYQGRAFVSIVAFTLSDMRPFVGGAWTAWLVKPIATHEFLNVRTYVRHGNESGIFFLREWLSNRLSVTLGPWPFGLPYKYGQLAYQHIWENKIISGSAIDPADGSAFSYRAALPAHPEFQRCRPGSFEEWLMERYTAYTFTRGKKKLFRVWHPAWPQVSVQVTVTQQTLLQENWPFFDSGTISGANFSPGARNVWMGRPRRCK